MKMQHIYNLEKKFEAMLQIGADLLLEICERVYGEPNGLPKLSDEYITDINTYRRGRLPTNANPMIRAIPFEFYSPSKNKLTYARIPVLTNREKAAKLIRYYLGYNTPIGYNICFNMDLLEDIFNKPEYALYLEYADMNNTSFQNNVEFTYLYFWTNQQNLFTAEEMSILLSYDITQKTLVNVMDVGKYRSKRRNNNFAWLQKIIYEDSIKVVEREAPKMEKCMMDFSPLLHSMYYEPYTFFTYNINKLHLAFPNHRKAYHNIRSTNCLYIPALFMASSAQDTWTTLAYSNVDMTFSEETRRAQCVVGAPLEANFNAYSLPELGKQVLRSYLNEVLLGEHE